MNTPLLQQVEFHTGLADPLLYACRLLRKASRQGARVAVAAPAPRLDALDRALWTFDERDFVPHARWHLAPPAVRSRSPVWLVDDLPGAQADPGCPAVWVNLGAALDEALDRWCERLIELLGEDPEEVREGRARWKAYRARGLQVVHHTAGGDSR